MFNGELSATMNMSLQLVAGSFEPRKKYEQYTFKPILRPLSDLDKVFEVDGNKYHTLTELQSLGIQPIHFSLMIHGDCSSVFFPIAGWNILYKHHFDVYNLIESGLAVDINTIEKEPEYEDAIMPCEYCSGDGRHRDDIASYNTPCKRCGGTGSVRIKTKKES